VKQSECLNNINELDRTADSRQVAVSRRLCKLLDTCGKHEQRRNETRTI